MSRAYQVVLAFLAGFLVTAGSIIGYWFSADGVEDDDCVGSECALEYAAVVTWGVVAGVLIGAVCALAVYAYAGRTRHDG